MIDVVSGRGIEMSDRPTHGPAEQGRASSCRDPACGLLAARG
jgi:hypothetical protein